MDRGCDRVVARAVVRFAVSSVVVLLVLLAGTMIVAGEIAQRQALDEARARGSVMARHLAAPLVNRAVRQHRPKAAAELSDVLGNRLQDGTVQHVKLWDSTGTVIWSDEEELVGRSFPLPDSVHDLFGTENAVAELSDLDKEENVAERSEGRALEVYAGAFDADGDPLVFEAYTSTNQMERDAHTIVVAYLPLVVGALALFSLAMFPLALSLARRVERAQLDRSRMMRHALRASDLERRRIAADLHDGVIQDLAGLGYALPIAERELRPEGDLGLARSTLSRAAGLLQHDVSRLRALMTDIYPPDLEGQGLRAALEDLTQATVAEGGLEATLDVDPSLDVTPDAGQLVYRVVREGLRNVVKHAHASHVRVEVGQDPGHVLVRVADDGEGPGLRPAPEGHLGLQLLADTVTDFGGELQLRPGARGGASLVARFPAAPVPG